MLLTLISCGEPLDPGLEGAPTPSVLTGFFSEENCTSDGRAIGHDDPPRIMLQWTRCPDDDFFSYVLCRSMLNPDDSPEDGLYGIMMSTDPDCTSFDDIEIIWGKEYIYALMTVNSIEICSWSNQIQLLIPGSAPTPSVLGISGVLADQVSLEWTTCPDTDFSRYILYRSTSPDILLDPDAAEILEVFYNQGSNTWVDIVPYGIKFYYCIKTVNDKDFSSWSNEVDAVATEPPFPWSQVAWIYTNSPVEGCTLPDGDLLYVSSGLSGNVSVYDMTSYYRVAQVPVGVQPQGITCSPGGEYVYVCCFGSGTVVTIDTEDNTVVGQFQVGLSCAKVLCPPPGNVLYVLCPAVRQLLALDATTGMITETLLLQGTPGDMVISHDGCHLYVTDRSRSKIVYLEVPGLTVEREVSIPDLSEGLEISEDGILFCSMNSGILYVIDGLSGELIHEFATGYSGYGLGLLPGTDYLYIADTGEGDICTIDASTGELLAVKTEDLPTEVICMPDGERVLVLSSDFSDIAVLGFR